MPEQPTWKCNNYHDGGGGGMGYHLQSLFEEPGIAQEWSTGGPQLSQQS